MVLILLTILISTYPWPIRQFGSAHGVSATLGDARGDSLNPRFHFGIDIPAGVGTKVYSIISDTAKLGGSGSDTYVRVGNYWYVHLENRIPHNTYVLGILDTINTPPDTIGKVLDYPNGDHLHFQIGPSSGPFVNPLSYDGGPIGYSDGGDPVVSSPFDFWRQGSEGQIAEELQSPLLDKVDIRAYCQDNQSSGGSSTTSGIYRLEWLVRNISTGESFGPFQTTIFPQVQPPNNGNPVLLVYDRHHYRTASPFYYWVTNPIIANQVEDHYWNTKQKIGAPDSVDAESLEVAKFKDGTYWVKVIAYDIRENADSESVYVQVANFRPTVEETDPEDGETDVSIHHPICVRFSEAMDQTVALWLAISISPGVSGDWQWLSDTTIEFTPDPALNKNTTYNVSLNPPLRDLQGQALIPYDFSFTTEDSDGFEFYPTKPDWEGYIPWWDVSVDWFYYQFYSQTFWDLMFPFYGSYYNMIYFNRRGSIWFDTNRDWVHFDLPTAGAVRVYQ